MSGIQDMIDRGILEEDPDSVLYLSAKVKDIMAAIENDDHIMMALNKKAINEEDRQIGFWTLVSMKYYGEASSEEIADAVHILIEWEQATRENRLNEWSMHLRLGEKRR